MSEWFDLVYDPTLQQGDIIESCSILSPEYPLDSDQGFETEYEVNCYTVDVIVMSQSCDLLYASRKKFFNVILCQLLRLSEVALSNEFMNSSYGKEQCRKGNLPGYHMLNESVKKEWQREISIVNFREILSLPYEFLLNTYIKEDRLRPRLKSPYREHLAQSFARYFMRVGLPVDIEPFSTEKNQERVMKLLDGMEPEVRDRIFSYFS